MTALIPPPAVGPLFLQGFLPTLGSIVAIILSVSLLCAAGLFIIYISMKVRN